MNNFNEFTKTMAAATEQSKVIRANISGILAKLDRMIGGATRE